MTVKDLKEIIKDVPDDYPVVIPYTPEDDLNNILGFIYARTATTLSNEEAGEDKGVLCVSYVDKNFLDQPTKIFML